jgi:hypothetical protein
MTHLCCTACRLRLDGAQAPEPPTCPECNRPLEAVTAREALGHRRIDIVDPAREWPIALSAALEQLPTPPRA